MKFLPLIWSGICRKPGRTVLVFLQVCVAFALFGVLQGLKSGVEQLIAEARADVLLVHGSLALFDPLPIALLERIKSVPGVELAIPVELFQTIYQKPDQKVGVVAIRPDPGWVSAFSFTVAPEYLETFGKTRTGALIRAGLARKYGWKIGDHIPLRSTILQQDGSTDWAFDVVGTYEDSDLNGGRDNILIDYDYFDAARVADKGTVKHFKVTVEDPSQAALVADEIDRRSANSANETRTESMRELAQSQLQSIGDLNFLIRSIVAAVFVALLFGTATMTMQSIRERLPELGVLKTLGFTDAAIFACILVETLLVFVVAAASGLAVSLVVFPLASTFVPGLSMPPAVVALGLGCALLAGAVSAAVPAMLAARSTIVASLAGR
jgi:putative ABC transport system permease protein